MECCLNPVIAYSDMSRNLLFQKLAIRNFVLKRQKVEQIKSRMFTFDETHRVIPLEYIKQINSNNIIFDIKSIDFEDRSEELKPLMGEVLFDVYHHSSAWPFKGPIEGPDEAAYKAIKYPMDLGQITERLESNYYTNSFMFCCDVRRMFINCRTFFPEDSREYMAANTMERFFVSQMTEVGLIILNGKDQDVPSSSKLKESEDSSDSNDSAAVCNR